MTDDKNTSNEALGCLGTSIYTNKALIIDYADLLEDLEKICYKVGYFVESDKDTEGSPEEAEDKWYQKIENNNSRIKQNNVRLYNCISLLQKYL